MADETTNLQCAAAVYAMLCQALEDRKWEYRKDEEKLVVYFGVNGDDIPINIIIAVDTDRQLIRLLSPLPFQMSEDKRIDGAIAACKASFGMADGSFDFDLSDGEIIFRIAAVYAESTIGPGLIYYLIDCCRAMVDHYNDKFLALEKGVISISDFVNEQE